MCYCSAKLELQVKRKEEQLKREEEERYDLQSL